jgi:hypothetical protein
MPVANALVPINRDNDAPHLETPRGAGRAHTGAHAAFVAHLIATSAQMPQTRARRRAEPQEAISAYAELGQRPTGVGRVLSRSL